MNMRHQITDDITIKKNKVKAVLYTVAIILIVIVFILK